MNSKIPAATRTDLNWKIGYAGRTVHADFADSPRTVDEYFQPGQDQRDHAGKEEDDIKHQIDVGLRPWASTDGR